MTVVLRNSTVVRLVPKATVRSKAVVLFLLTFCNCSMFCCTLLCVHSSITIILMGARELVALLNLSSWCLVMVKRLFLAVLQGCLRFVIVVFQHHTHYFCTQCCVCRRLLNSSNFQKLKNNRADKILVVCDSNAK